MEPLCQKSTYPKIVIEYSSVVIVYLKHMQEGYWGWAVNDSANYHFDLFLHPCPPGYCKCSQNTSLGQTSCAFTYTNSDPDAQCVNERQGRSSE